MSRAPAEPADWKDALAKVMHAEREATGLSVRKYAEHAGLSYPTMARILRGAGCDVTTLVRLRETTRLSFDEMLEPVLCEHEWPEYPLPIPGRRLYECVKCRNLGEESVHEGI